MELVAAAIGVLALFTLALAALVAARGRGSASSLFLGLFLLTLVVAQVARLVDAPADALARAVGAAEIIGGVFVYSAATALAGRPAARSRVALLVLAAAVALGLALAPRPSGSTADLAWTAIGFVASAGANLAAFFVALRAYVPAPQEPGRRLLFASLAFATLPLAHRLAGWVTFAGTAATGIVWDPEHDLLLVYVPLSAFTVWLVLHIARRVPRGAARTTGIVAVLVSLGIAAADHLLALHLRNDWRVLPAELMDAYGMLTSPMRWLVVAVLASAAVIRHGALPMDDRTRRLAARLLVGIAAVGIGWVAWLVVGILSDQPVDDVSLPLALAVLAAIALSQGFRRGVDAVAGRVYGVPAAVDRGAREETYRAAVARALTEGRPVDDPSLDHLRRDLGLDTRTAHSLQGLADEAAGGPLAPGRVLAGRYEVRQVIGRGGAGTVFLAHDRLLAREVALKEVPRVGGDPDRLLAEPRTAGSLAHPGIAAVHDVVRRGGGAVLVAEYVAGPNLEERLAQGPLAADEGVAMLIQVLEALAVVHARGIVHRDLKPANILLTPDGRPKLADFGIAKMRAGDTVGPGEARLLIGTPEYMAPEQRRAERVTARTDVWQVARIFRRALAAPLPDGLEAVLARAAADDPEARYAHAAEMLAAVRSAG